MTFVKVENGLTSLFPHVPLPLLRLGGGMYEKGHKWGLVKFQRTHGNNTLAVLHGELREVVWTIRGCVL